MTNSNSQFLPFNHGAIFQNIRNFLAGRLLGATRDQALLEELFKCVFAKHWLIRVPSLAIPGEISKSYRAALAHVKTALPGVFASSDEIELDPVALRYVDEQLEAADIEGRRADVFSELYEAFAASALKASEGQFFTPVVAVNLLVGMVGLSPGQSVCDPACGAGGFLIAAAKEFARCGAGMEQIASWLNGFDKDAYLARIARGRLALFLDRIPNVICADSLAGVTLDGKNLSNRKYDVILTNPPFGAKIIAADSSTMARFVLAKKWVEEERGTSGYTTNGVLSASTPPQILFVEQCLKLLKPGGTLGAILPESLISTKSYGFVVQYMHSQADLTAVVGMPESLFKTSGKGGTHTKTVAVVLRKKPSPARHSTVFFAEAKWCGHDSRGRPVPLNDIPTIAANFSTFRRSGKISQRNLGTAVPREKVGLILAPRAFEFDAESEVERIAATHDVVVFGELVRNEVVAVSTGDEVGKLTYGTGKVPFIRTSDISNWEIKLDPKHCVSREVYERYGSRQDTRPRDILMVKDGTYLIGTCALVTEHDLPMLYQSHIYKIRVLKNGNLTPFLLLAALSSDFVQRQIRSFCVSQDIIDSLGDKIMQLRIPIPRAWETTKRISDLVEKVVAERAAARELARQACSELMAG
jgi:type I restriction enzyme M protein